MAIVETKIGPADHGRRMSLADFEHVEVQEGYLYELGRGVIVVSDVPKPRHAYQVVNIREQLVLYKHADQTHSLVILAGNECKLLVDLLESERHPDIAVYKGDFPDEDYPWREWIPDLVIEVISSGSEMRDYLEKREEYLALGVKEYWIVDGEKEEILILQKHGKKWREKMLRPPETYRCRVLPGFVLESTPVFARGKSKKR